MKLVRRKKVDVIVCYKLDRLGRSLPHLAQIISELDQHNISLVATSQGIDTNHDSPAGRLQMHVLIAVAEFERSLIVERVRAGQAAARAKGVKFGRTATLWNRTAFQDDSSSSRVHIRPKDRVAGASFSNKLIHCKRHFLAAINAPTPSNSLSIR
jgi:DNA invertase Pin-like site-specific DNA recombinase